MNYSYERVQFTVGPVAAGYQEILDGRTVTRLTDLDGNTLDTSQPMEFSVVGFDTPVWALPATVDVQPVSTAGRKLTKFAFLSRFTIAEQVAIDLASIDNPATDQQARVNAATLRVALTQMNAAECINLDLPAVAMVVGMMESFGLIAPGRAAEILTPSATATEAFGA